MQRINTVKLIGEKRIKTILIVMIFFIPSILFFFTLAIYFTMPNNFILFIALYLIFGTLFVFNIYLLFNTYKKLIIANLFVGICFVVLSISVYIVFSYMVTHGDISNILVLLIFYVLGVALTEVFLLKKRFFNFKQRGKMRNTFLLYLLGAWIGKDIYEYLKKAYGKDISHIMGVGFLVIAVGFAFIGVFYINKYIIIRKYEFQVQIVYEE